MNGHQEIIIKKEKYQSAMMIIVSDRVRSTYKLGTTIKRYLSHESRMT